MKMSTVRILILILYYDTTLIIVVLILNPMNTYLIRILISLPVIGQISRETWKFWQLAVYRIQYSLPLSVNESLKSIKGTVDVFAFCIVFCSIIIPYLISNP